MRKYNLIYQPSMPINELTRLVIAVAIEIHKELGPGFREAYYQRAMKLEFDRLQIPNEREKETTITFNDVKIGNNKLDFVVDNRLVIELKSQPELKETNMAQMLTYLRCSGYKLGLILNFGQPKLAIKRVIL